MAKKKMVKKYTLAEFKAWLEGIEEIQPNDWHPDLTQWRMIRDKIGAIQEPTKQSPVVTPAPTFSPPPRLPNNVSYEVPNGVPVIPQHPPQSSLGLTAPAEPNIEMTPAAKAALAGKLPPEMATSSMGETPKVKIKTPNIDTRDGNYASNFT